MRDRVILHSDLNGFYASVECFENPKIRNYPVAVCGNAELRQGIVLAKNEIAKKYGIKTGDVIWEAKQKCPFLLIVTANFDKYLRYSAIVKDVYNDYTDQIESFGIDEAWLDVTGQDGEKVANEIRQRVLQEIGLTVSVGVSFNKIFAKLGSDIKKPNAVTVISKDNFPQKIFSLPASDLLYVGRATKAKLEKYNIHTIGDIANTKVIFLKKILGKWGEYIWSFANGYDRSIVQKTSNEAIIKSVGNSTTAIRDLQNFQDVLMIVTVLAESVAARLREQWLKGSVISLSLRDNELNVWNKQIKMYKPTFISRDIIKYTMQIFKDYHFILPIRSIGIRVADLYSASSPRQIELDEQELLIAEQMEYTIDNLRSRFGYFCINRGVEYLDRTLTKFCPKIENVIHPCSYF